MQTIEVQTSGTHVLAFRPPFAWLVPTGAAANHTIEAIVTSNCPDAGRWRVQEVRIDVVRAVG